MMVKLFICILLLQAQWGQPTALGFSVFSAGLAIAALNVPETEENEEEYEEEESK